MGVWLGVTVELRVLGWAKYREFRRRSLRGEFAAACVRTNGEIWERLLIAFYMFLELVRPCTGLRLRHDVHFIPLLLVL